MTPALWSRKPGPGPGLAVLVLIGVLSASCGYALVGTGSGILSPDIRVIAVLPLQGQLPRAEIQQRMTQSIVDAFTTRTNRVIQLEPEGADAIVEGTVQRFQITPIGWDEQNRANRFQVIIVMQLAFRRVNPEKILYHAQGWTFRAQFEIESTATAEYFDPELLALDEISEEFGRAVVSAILEGF